jgi:hypothetical protein
MSLENMERILAESLRQCPEGFIPRTPNEVAFKAKHLYWRAFSAFAFMLWTRYARFTSFLNVPLIVAI